MPQEMQMWLSHYCSLPHRASKSELKQRSGVCGQSEMVLARPTMLSQHRASPLLPHGMKMAQCSGSDRTVAILPSSPSQRTVASPPPTA
ncbi:hypothetical protein HBH54_251750 [Parastagonospora nodorum]|nr:hypothetical protein HBH54_251750 [Parastagonospora nodorum]